MPRRKSIKRLSYQNLIHPGGRKRDQNEDWVLFFCRCRDKCRNQWFPFSEGKKKMKRKGCKSEENKAGCWHSVQWCSVFLRALMGSFIISTAMGWCVHGSVLKRPFISLISYHGVRGDILLSSSTVFIEYIFKIKKSYIHTTHIDLIHVIWSDTIILYDEQINDKCDHSISNQTLDNLMYANFKSNVVTHH